MANEKSTMSIDGIEQTTIKHRFGDIVFDMIMVDGIGIPRFPPTRDNGFPQRLKDIQNMEYRSDDVLLVTYPKSGTHWIHQILHMLVNKKAEYKRPLQLASLLESIPDLKIADNEVTPRIFTSHLPYRFLPKNHIANGGKIIHVSRNPKDVYVSLYYHATSSHTFGKQFSSVTWDQFFDLAIRQEVTTYGSWFDYEKQMVQAKSNNPNILTIYFEDMKKVCQEEIRKVANFLDVDISDELIQEIDDKCSIQNMKSELANSTLESLTDYEKFVEKMNDKEFQMPNFFRKGVVGDWKNHFTVTQNEEFEAKFAEKLKAIDFPLYYKY